MHILLFIGYSLLCGYGILKIPLIRKSGLGSGLLLSLFALHVLTGCLHNIIAWHFYPAHGDVWNDFQYGFVERYRLVSNFDRFRLDNSRWTYISHDAIVFIHILLDFLSFDNLYINTLLFAFPVFIGNVALYRLFRRHFSAGPLTAATVFLLPSTLFWTACMHREAALFALLGGLLYWLDRLSVSWQVPGILSTSSQVPATLSTSSEVPATLSTSSQVPATRRRALLYVALFFLLIVYFRSAVALTLIPAFLAWYVFSRPLPSPSSRSLPSPSSRPLPRRRLLILGGICTGVVIVILVIPGLFSSLLQTLGKQQQAFQVLEGHSRLYLPVLNGTFGSLVHVLPAAILNGFLEPLPGSGGQPIYWVFTLELLAIWGIVAIALILPFFTRPSSSSGPSAPPILIMANSPQLETPSKNTYPPESQSAPNPNTQSAPDPTAQSPKHSPSGSAASPNPSGRLRLAARDAGFPLFCLLFAVAGMLLIGILVPFAGAIIRYRSIYLPFLLAPFLNRLSHYPPLKRINARLTHLFPAGA